MVATRLRDTAFKRELQRMPLGSTVRMEGPFGNLVLHADQTRPAVFLAGGIGITPFRSMVVQAAMQRSPHPMVLFYSNRRPEDAAFLDELQSLRDKNPHYRFVATMTEPANSSRPGRADGVHQRGAALQTPRQCEEADLLRGRPAGYGRRIAHDVERSRHRPQRYSHGNIRGLLTQDAVIPSRSVFL